MTLQIGLMKEKGLRKGRNRAGFTLVELLIVSFIILMLVSISMPLFRKTFTNLELRETASNISKFIAFAQQEAIVDRTIYKIHFDFNNKTYRLLKYSGEKSLAGQGIKAEFESPGGKLGRVFALPGKIDIEGEKNEILFYPDGHSDIVELKLVSMDKKAIIITTTGILGNVTVAKEE